jgi:hypothetical protein
MTPESLALIRSANSKLSRFLARLPDLSQSGSSPAIDLGATQKQLAIMSSTIASVGRHLRISEALDVEARAQVETYAANLERLRSFIIALEVYAAAQRRQLAARAGQVKQSLAWCAALKLTTPE